MQIYLFIFPVITIIIATGWKEGEEDDEKNK